MEERILNIVMRVMPNGEDFDIELPSNATAEDLIQTILDAGLGIPKNDQSGNPYTYIIWAKGAGIKMEPQQTMKEARIVEGDILLMLPNLVAGGVPVLDIILRIIPNNIELDVSVPCDATAGEIIETILDQRLEIGIDREYSSSDFVLKDSKTNRAIGNEESLLQAEISSNDILMMVPNMLAY